MSILIFFFVPKNHSYFQMVNVENFGNFFWLHFFRFNLKPNQKKLYFINFARIFNYFPLISSFINIFLMNYFELSINFFPQHPVNLAHFSLINFLIKAFFGKLFTSCLLFSGKLFKKRSLIYSISYLSFNISFFDYINAILISFLCLSLLKNLVQVLLFWKSKVEQYY